MKINGKQIDRVIEQLENLVNHMELCIKELEQENRGLRAELKSLQKNTIGKGVLTKLEKYETASKSD